MDVENPPFDDFPQETIGFPHVFLCLPFFMQRIPRPPGVSRVLGPGETCQKLLRFSWHCITVHTLPYLALALAFTLALTLTLALTIPTYIRYIHTLIHYMFIYVHIYIYIYIYIHIYTYIYIYIHIYTYIR